MKWSIKHKSGRVLFVTDSKVTADNREKMGWIVEEVKMTSREQFEAWYKSKYLFQGYEFDKLENGSYQWIESMWQAWQASRAAIEIELPDVYGDKYTPSSCTMDGFDFEKYLDDLCSEIQSSGLKVKK